LARYRTLPAPRVSFKACATLVSAVIPNCLVGVGKTDRFIQLRASLALSTASAALSTTPCTCPPLASLCRQFLAWRLSSGLWYAWLVGCSLVARYLRVLVAARRVSAPSLHEGASAGLTRRITYDTMLLRLLVMPTVPCAAAHLCCAVTNARDHVSSTHLQLLDNHERVRR